MAVRTFAPQRIDAVCHEPTITETISRSPRAHALEHVQAVRGKYDYYEDILDERTFTVVARFLGRG